MQAGLGAVMYVHIHSCVKKEGRGCVYISTPAPSPISWFVRDVPGVDNPWMLTRKRADRPDGGGFFVSGGGGSYGLNFHPPQSTCCFPASFRPSPRTRAVTR